MIGVFKTIRVPTTHIYQNHIDELHKIIGNFCEENKDYSWSLVSKKKDISDLRSIETFLLDKRPSSLTYKVSFDNETQILIIKIENGVEIYLKNGSYSLHGLYSVIVDHLSILKIPSSIVFLRRYWLLSLTLSIWTVPVITSLLLGNTQFAMYWGIFIPFLAFVILISTFANAPEESPINDFKWDEIVLKTKIGYGEYNDKQGISLFVFLKSTKTMISIIASLVTIISFLIYLYR